MIKRTGDYERQILIDKYLKLGLSEAQAKRRVDSHIRLMVLSPLTMLI